jgi:serine/threonine protein kinase
MLVVIPDDFRKKYKIVSTLSEKDISCFGFRASEVCGLENIEFICRTSEEDDNANSDSERDDYRPKHDSAVTIFKAIDRQKKYVIVERTRVDVFEHSTMQIEFFNRIDCLRWVNHTCIPSILDVFDTPHDYTIVFQYGVGKNLAELLAQRGAMSSPKAVRALVLALVDTLKHLHHQRIAHRHICPKQLIVSRFNHFSKPKDLTVTGLSRVARVPLHTASTRDDEPTAKGNRKVLLEKKSTSTASSATSRSACESFSDMEELAGVPERYLDVFCAPELAQPGHGLEVDLYSLGVVLYSLILGSVPTSKKNISMDSLECSSSLKRLISSLLRSDPMQRPSLRRVEKYFAKSFLDDDDAVSEGKYTAVPKPGKEVVVEFQLHDQHVTSRSKSPATEFTDEHGHDMPASHSSTSADKRIHGRSVASSGASCSSSFDARISDITNPFSAEDATFLHASQKGGLHDERVTQEECLQMLNSALLSPHDSA